MGTLAVAIAAGVVTFAVVDEVLLRPLPMPDADRVVVIWPWERATPATIGEVSYATFRSWQQEAGEFELSAAMGSTTWGLVLRNKNRRRFPLPLFPLRSFRWPAWRAACTDPCVSLRRQ